MNEKQVPLSNISYTSLNLLTEAMGAVPCTLLANQPADESFAAIEHWIRPASTDWDLPMDRFAERYLLPAVTAIANQLRGAASGGKKIVTTLPAAARTWAKDPVRGLCLYFAFGADTMLIATRYAVRESKDSFRQEAFEDLTAYSESNDC